MQHRILLALSALLSLPSSIYSARILLMIPVGGKSQKHVFYGLGRGLVEQGHNVTLFSGYKPSSPVEGITEIVPSTFGDIFKEGNVINVIEAKEKGFSGVWRQVKRVFVDSQDLLLASKELDEVVNQQWDLVVFGAFCHSVYFIPYLQNIPFIFMTPVGYLPMLTSNLGNPTLPALIPFHMLDQSADEMNFFDRIKNVVIHQIMNFLIKYVLMPYCDELVSKKYPSLQIPSSSEIERNASLVLLNANYAIDDPQIVLPNAIAVGGLHCEDAKSLPRDIQKFVGSSEFAYFSLGSVIRPENMTTVQRATILTALSKLPYKVLLKWDSEKDPDLPKNVLARSWFNQQDILGNKQCRLFITHAGVSSFQESVCHGVPLLALPLVADQLGNAHRAQRLGIASVLPWDQLSVEGIVTAAEEAGRPEIRQEAQRRRRLMFSPHHPRALAVSWVELVLRNGGASHLKSPAVDMGVIRFYSLDVIAVLFATFVALILVVYKSFLFCFRCCCRKTTYKEKHASQSSKNKKQD